MTQSKCGSNGLLNLTTSIVNIDGNTGLATFENITIDKTGMYVFLVDVTTFNSPDYSLHCMSFPVIVKNSQDSLLANDNSNQEPDVHLTFTGNYTTQTSANLKKFESMIYNCLLEGFGLLMQSSITLYQGSIKASIGTSSSADKYALLVSSLNSSNFSLSDGVVLTNAVVAGKSYSFSNVNVDPTPSPSPVNSDYKLENNIFINLIIIIIYFLNSF